jgi:hypothetical protein
LIRSTKFTSTKELAAKVSKPITHLLVGEGKVVPVLQKPFDGGTAEKTEFRSLCICEDRRLSSENVVQEDIVPYIIAHFLPRNLFPSPSLNVFGYKCEKMVKQVSAQDQLIGALWKNFDKERKKEGESHYFKR